MGDGLVWAGIYSLTPSPTGVILPLLVLHAGRFTPKPVVARTVEDIIKVCAVLCHKFNLMLPHKNVGHAQTCTANTNTVAGRTKRSVRHAVCVRGRTPSHPSPLRLLLTRPTPSQPPQQIKQPNRSTAQPSQLPNHPTQARGVKPTLSPNLNVLATVEALQVGG